MERYIEKFFDKKADGITIEHIEEFFKNRQDESSTLEFKSGEVEIHDVFKEISAFLNTEGGLLIIGAPRETKETSGKRVISYCQGQITYSKFVSKDWLHQRIYSNITPSPFGIEIKEISTEKGQIFLLDIPQSKTPPHQANSDGRYYIRIDNEAKPAPHGLVQALFDRRHKPILSARIQKMPSQGNMDILDVSIRNESNTPADKVSFIIDVYNVLSAVGNASFDLIHDGVLGDKHSLSGNASQVLVSIIAIGMKIKVRHKGSKYLVAVSYWSKQSDFDCTFFLLQPNSDKIETSNWLDQGPTLIDRVKALYS